MTADFAQQRAMMVEGQLRTMDVSSVPLLEAMREIPREAFVPSVRRGLAYIDDDLEIAPATGEAPARYLMEPAPFARLVQLAGVRAGDFVLDVGCGTGYSSAVLSRLASSVVALESDTRLADRAGTVLADLGYDNVAVVQGNMTEGYPSEAPYDVIVVGGAVDEVPAALKAQIKEGGRLVAVIGHGHAARAHLFINDDGIVSGRAEFNAGVRPLPGFGRPRTFVF